MATKFDTAHEFATALDKYNSEYAENKGHEQYLAGHDVPLNLSCESLNYVVKRDRGKNGMEDRYSEILDKFTVVITHAWYNEVMGTYIPSEDEVDDSELWHNLAIYKIRRGYGLLQQAAYRLASNHSFHIVTGSEELNKINKSLPYQKYFSEDVRDNCDGPDLAYSAFVDGFLNCGIKFHEEKVIQLLKEGAHEIASGD